jgi:hypothetical protein
MASIKTTSITSALFGASLAAAAAITTPAKAQNTPICSNSGLSQLIANNAAPLLVTAGEILNAPASQQQNLRYSVVEKMVTLGTDIAFCANFPPVPFPSNDTPQSNLGFSGAASATLQAVITSSALALSSQSSNPTLDVQEAKRAYTAIAGVLPLMSIAAPAP